MYLVQFEIIIRYIRFFRISEIDFYIQKSFFIYDYNLKSDATDYMLND